MTLFYLWFVVNDIMGAEVSIKHSCVQLYPTRKQWDYGKWSSTPDRLNYFRMFLLEWKTLFMLPSEASTPAFCTAPTHVTSPLIS